MARRNVDTDGMSRGTPAPKRNRAQEYFNSRRSEQPDWGRIDATLIWQAIQRCTVDDGAIMFGYSRDGGAYSIRVYDGGDGEKAYFHNDQEVHDFLSYLAEG